MAIFRKKPVMIEAEQLAEEIVVPTLEGNMRGHPGDWLITGVMGEKYVCRDDIFKITYEAVEKPKKTPPPSGYKSDERKVDRAPGSPVMFADIEMWVKTPNDNIGIIVKGPDIGKTDDIVVYFPKDNYCSVFNSRVLVYVIPSYKSMPVHHWKTQHDSD